MRCGLFWFGEASRLFSQFACPLPDDAPTNAHLRKQGKLWLEPPKRKLGPNSGKPGDLSGRKRGRPDYVVHWRDILEADEGGYPGSTEKHGIDAKFGRRARFSRIGIHFEVLPPGRRTSWPHAERDEEEWVYVVAGTVECWIDGRLHKMTEGDFVGFEARTNITHVVINNGGEDALLLIGSEASRARNQFWYPMHPHRNEEIGEEFWSDHPRLKLGPHDGLPDALRARPAGCRPQGPDRRQPRRDGAEASMKRFYKTAGIKKVADTFAVTLDDRPVKTPGGEILALGSAPLAEAIAAEWAGQGETIDQRRMPLTGLANTAQDHVARDRTATLAQIETFARHDLVCYRATDPAELVAREAAAWTDRSSGPAPNTAST